MAVQVNEDVATLVTFEAATPAEAFAAASTWFNEHPAAVLYAVDYDQDIDDEDRTAHVLRAAVLPEV